MCNENSESELLDAIRNIISDCGYEMRDIAYSAGMEPRALREFLRLCKGTQITKAERVLNVLGYEIVLKKKKEEV